MKSIVVVAAFVASLFCLPKAQALPQGATYNYFYDENWDLIGEKDILCDGSHYTWGVTAGAAHISGYSESCSTGEGSWHCYYYSSGCGCYIEDDLAHCGI